jgi:hypothetical protein
MHFECKPLAKRLQSACIPTAIRTQIAVISTAFFEILRKGNGD